MSEKELRKIVGLVVLNYSSMEFPEEKIKFWLEMLSDLDFKRTQLALKNLFCTLSFPPTVADIRKAYDNIGKAKRTAFDASAVLTTAISKYGYTNAEKALDYIKEQDELLHKIVKGIGYYNMCKSDINFLRKEVSGIYTELLKEESENALVQQKLLREAKALLQNSVLNIENESV